MQYEVNVCCRPWGSVVACREGPRNCVGEFAIVEPEKKGFDELLESSRFQRVLRPEWNLFRASSSKRALDILGLRSSMDSSVIVETTELISTAMFARSAGFIPRKPFLVALAWTLPRRLRLMRPLA